MLYELYLKCCSGKALECQENSWELNYRHRSFSDESFFRVFLCFGLDLGASGSPRLETLANESWSLELLFAKVSAQGEPLALTNH